MKLRITLLIIVISFFANIFASIHTINKDDTIALFCFTENADNKIQFNNPVVPILESKLIERGFKVYTIPITPLASKQMLQYTIVENEELKDYELKTGKLFFELGSDGSVKIESGDGLAAYSKLEINSISWMLDKEKALKIASKNKCQYAIFVTALTDDITKSLNSEQLNYQKSVSSSIMMSLVEIDTKTTVKSFYQESPSMDSNRFRAATKGWSFLIDNAINQWFEQKK